MSLICNESNPMFRIRKALQNTVKQRSQQSQYQVTKQVKKRLLASGPEIWSSAHSTWNNTQTKLMQWEDRNETKHEIKSQLANHQESG